MKKILFLFCIFIPSFISAELQWTQLQPIPRATSTGSVKLALNQKCKGMIAWHDTSKNEILSAIYHFVEKKWTEHPSLPVQGKDILILALRFTDQDKADVLWFDEELNTLSFAEWNEKGWQAPLTINLIDSAQNVQAAMDPKGNCTVVWMAWNGVEQIMQGLFFAKDIQSWSPISDLCSIGLNCKAPRIAINQQGKGVVAWEATLSASNFTTQSFIQAVTFNQKNYEWSNPIFFGYDWTETLLTHHDVAIDHIGNIVIAWEKKKVDLNETQVQYVRFISKKNQWSYISELENDAHSPQLNKDPLRVQMVWSEPSEEVEHLHVSQIDIANNLWMSSHKIPAAETGMKGLKIKGDPAGKLNLVWLVNNRIFLTHFDKEWSPTVHLDRNLNCKNFEIENDLLGNTMLACVDASKQLYCSTGNYLIAPELFKVERIEMRYPNYKIYHAELSWQHSESPNVLSYIIKRNGVVLAVLPPHIHQFTDNRCPVNTAHYELSIVNVDNIESLPVKRAI